MNRSNSTWLSWVIVVLGAGALAMSVTTVFVATGNREMQRDVARRQQEVNQALQLSPLNNQLIQTLAAISVQRNDAQLGKILTDNGISVQLNTPSPSPSPSPPAAPAGATQ